MPSHTQPDNLIKVILTFPKANVCFIVTCTHESFTKEPAKFRIDVNSNTHQEPLKLNEAHSPQLSDWAKGYARWLHRANIQAKHNDDAIVGTFTSVLEPEVLLENIREACLMIRQRFEHYESSILM
jgi:hypothetical protein